MAAADLGAARVPLETAEACLGVLELAAEAAEHGNVNACTDSGVSGLLARAAVEGALLNVEINLKSLPASADKEAVEAGLRRIQEAMGPAARRCTDAVHTAMNA